MTATKTSKPAQDGTGAAFNLELAAESGSGNTANATYLTEPSGETIISPATATKQPAIGTAGAPSADVLTVQGIASMTPMKTDGSAVTQPVSAASLPLPSGASTAAKQPALGTAGTASADVITVQGIASMTPMKTDSSAVTQPISAASLPLPTSAATAAKQPALGTAGTPSSDVITVQGAASMTALAVTVAAGAAAIGSIIGRTSNPSVTPVVTAGAYTAGQEAGGLMTFAVGGAGSGVLESITVTSKSVQTTGLKLYIFDTNPSHTTWTDKTTAAINVADVSFVRGPFILSPDSGLGTHTVWELDGIACSFVGANLYGILTVSATPTFGSTSDLVVKLGIIDD